MVSRICRIEIARICGALDLEKEAAFNDNTTHHSETIAVVVRSGLT